MFDKRKRFIFNHYLRVNLIQAAASLAMLGGLGVFIGSAIMHSGLGFSGSTTIHQLSIDGSTVRSYQRVSFVTEGTNKVSFYTEDGRYITLTGPHLVEY